MNAFYLATCKICQDFSLVHEHCAAFEIPLLIKENDFSNKRITSVAVKFDYFLFEERISERNYIKFWFLGGVNGVVSDEHDMAPQEITSNEVEEVVNEQELKYWKTINENPSDFTSWTYLLQFVEQEVSGEMFASSSVLSYSEPGTIRPIFLIQCLIIIQFLLRI